MIALWVAVGAALGAPLRYLTDRAVQKRHSSRFPLGTLTVNLVAAFALGLLGGLTGLSPRLTALLGTGLCGALSTWSTFAFETVDLAVAAPRGRVVAGAYLLVTLVAGIGLAVLGRAIA